MLFIPILIAALFTYLFQSYFFKKNAFKNLDYNVTLSSEEVFEGEDFFMYEELTNGKAMGLPYVKVETSLPYGLNLRLISGNTESLNRNGKTTRNIRDTIDKEDTYDNHIQSVFVLNGNEKIKRRWRVTTYKRGIYNLDHAVIVTNNVFGSNPDSRNVRVPSGRKNKITVLPRIIDLEKHFTLSQYMNGDTLVRRGLITDPLYLCGTREYNISDPMRSINWKSTAVHGNLMVNIEEYTQKHQFNLILNMQSRMIELHPKEPSSPETVELCINVCATILDTVAAEGIPIRLFANTTAVGLEDFGAVPVGGNDAVLTDESGEKTSFGSSVVSGVSAEEGIKGHHPKFDGDFVCGDTAGKLLSTPVYTGSQDTVHALRLLSALPMDISAPIERMLDHIAANPNYYSGGDNIVIVSSYICDRMIIFHRVMKKNGVRVIFYITSANRNAMVIPEDIEVYFKTGK